MTLRTPTGIPYEYDSPDMRVLIACERTAMVRDAFRARGHDAWSCDTEPTEGDPAWHIRDDVLGHLDDGWDLMVAFPPCTFLSNIGGKWLYHAGQPDRLDRRAEAVTFVRLLLSAPVPRIALENPIGHLSTAIRKPDQIIEPWQFGDPYHKKTCLWLQGLALLRPVNPVLPAAHWVNGNRSPVAASGLPRRYTPSRDRERTFAGIAAAMADQWGGCPVRFCKVCRGPFTGRADARTCSDRCRQRLSRIRRAKRDMTAAVQGE